MNGHPCPKATYARLSGYVEQSDIHSEKATVHESLIFSAALRMAPNVPRRVRMAFVEEVSSPYPLVPLLRLSALCKAAFCTIGT